MPVKLKFSVFKFLHIKNVIYKAEHITAGTSRRFHIFADFVNSLRLSGKFKHSYNSVHRSTQVVAYSRKKVGAFLVPFNHPVSVTLHHNCINCKKTYPENHTHAKNKEHYKRRKMLLHEKTHVDFWRNVPRMLHHCIVYYRNVKQMKPFVYYTAKRLRIFTVKLNSKTKRNVRHRNGRYSSKTFSYYDVFRTV